MKKNVRNVPQAVRTKLRSLSGRDIVAGCARQFSTKDIHEGDLAHLQIELRDDGLSLPERIDPLPRRSNSRHATSMDMRWCERIYRKRLTTARLKPPIGETRIVELIRFGYHIRHIQEISNLLVSWNLSFIALIPVHPGPPL